MGRGRLQVRVQAAVRSPQSAEGSMTLASIPSQAALPLHSSQLLHCRAPPATTQHQHHKHTNLVCRLQGMHHTAHTARRETPTCLRPVSLARRLVDRSMANLCLMGAAQRCEVPPLEFLPADVPRIPILPISSCRAAPGIATCVWLDLQAASLPVIQPANGAPMTSSAGIVDECCSSGKP